MQKYMLIMTAESNIKHAHWNTFYAHRMQYITQNMPEFPLGL